MVKPLKLGEPSSGSHRNGNYHTGDECNIDLFFSSEFFDFYANYAHHLIDFRLKREKIKPETTY
jgi:hypothetical protein